MAATIIIQKSPKWKIIVFKNRWINTEKVAYFTLLMIINEI